MTDAAQEVYDAGPYQSFWYDDTHQNVHVTVLLELEDLVDARALERAWEHTVHVYPLLGRKAFVEDEELFFGGQARVIAPVLSRVPLALATEATDFRAFCVTYYERTITLCGYRSLVDERGMMKVVHTLMAHYVADLAGEQPDAQHAMLEEGRPYDAYFVQSTQFVSQDYTPLPLTLYRDAQEVFEDEAVRPDSDAGVMVGELEVDGADFDAWCSRMGSDAEVGLLAIIAHSLRGRINAEACASVSLGVSCDLRATFGVEDTIAPCSNTMPVLVGSEVVASGEIRDIIREIDKQRSKQRLDDYIKSHVALENTYGLLRLRRESAYLRYVGAFDMGEATRGVRRVSLYDNALRGICALRLGDVVRLCVQYGSCTDAYLQALCDSFVEQGVRARIGISACMQRAESASVVA